MSVSVQESLLDMCDEERGPSLGALGSSVRRTALAHAAWVDLRPTWLAGSGAVFGALVETVPWRAEKRQMYDKVVAVPRLLCFYGEDEPLPDPVLTAARRALNAHYGPELGEPFRTAGLCLYRDGRDSVAWHGDTIGRGKHEDTMVAILSLARRGRCCYGREAGARRCGSRSGTATCWSWAVAASAPGSTPYQRRPRLSDRGSACSSGRAGCADNRRPGMQPSVVR
jgi:alkylated DNA repair dioxygenase AlkB